MLKIFRPVFRRVSFRMSKVATSRPTVATCGQPLSQVRVGRPTGQRGQQAAKRRIHGRHIGGCDPSAGVQTTRTRVAKGRMIGDHAFHNGGMIAEPIGCHRFATIPHPSQHPGPVASTTVVCHGRPINNMPVTAGDILYVDRSSDQRY